MTDFGPGDHRDEWSILPEPVTLRGCLPFLLGIIGFWAMVVGLLAWLALR